MPHFATYSPEDDKIRLYFDGRIPKDEWDRLKAAGFSWTMKQASDMVAHWSVEREDIALDMCGEIGDEDTPRAERAADRAERFEGYGDKREGEAIATADKHDAGPSVHAAQSAERAERSAARYERIAGRAVSQWSKAEYWTRRTAGVIANALHLERADVRHRRIKGLEAEERKFLAEVNPSQVVEGVDAVVRYCGQEYADKGHDVVGIFGQGRAKHARSFRKDEGRILSERSQRYLDHIRLRLAYERQMLIGQGGTLADESDEIKPGGFVGSLQVQKVTKDRAGRINGVYFIGPHPYREGETWLHKIKAESIKPGSYRAPTDSELEAFNASQKAKKAAKPKAPPLLNLSSDDAKRLQDFWNAETIKNRSGPSYLERWGAKYHAEQVEKMRGIAVIPMTQEAYSGLTGNYGPCKTIDVCDNWTAYHHRSNNRPVAFRIRIRSGASSEMYCGDHVVILTDKPTHALPERVTVEAEAEHATAQ